MSESAARSLLPAPEGTSIGLARQYSRGDAKAVQKKIHAVLEVSPNITPFEMQKVIIEDLHVMMILSTVKYQMNLARRRMGKTSEKKIKAPKISSVKSDDRREGIVAESKHGRIELRDTGNGLWSVSQVFHAVPRSLALNLMGQSMSIIHPTDD